MDEYTQPKCFVFVLMPFSEEFRDDYEVGIKPACKDAGAYCERVDEQFFEEGILDRVYNQISKADVLVALMTGRNPNVFYEVGYAHALGKRVVLLTSAAEDIPFDLKHYSHIVYGNRIADLKNQLQRRIEWCIANPAASLARAEVPVRIFAGGAELSENQLVEFNPDAPFTFAVHNPTTLMYPAGSFQLGIVTPQVFTRCFSTKEEAGIPEVRQQMVPGQGASMPTWMPIVTPTRRHPEAEHFPLTGAKILHLLSWWSGALFPSGWASVSCFFEVEQPFKKGELHELSIRIFTELGTKEFPFRVKIA